MKAIPRPSAALALALCVVAAVRATLLLWPDAFVTISETSTNDNFIDAECRFRYTTVTKPQVVIMGSSRFVPFPADLLAERLHLPKYAIANTSIFGNSFWTTLAFLRRNPEELRDAKVVIFDILPFQLCVNDMFPENDKVFLKFSTLSEREAVMDPADRARAVADEVIMLGELQTSHPIRVSQYRAQGLPHVVSEPGKRRRFRCRFLRHGTLHQRPHA